MPTPGEPLVVAIDRAQAASIDEAKYVLRTLLRTAGFPVRFVWSDRAAGAADVYYGPGLGQPARLRIPAVAWPFASAPRRTPHGVRDDGGLRHLLFDGAPWPPPNDAEHGASVASDIVFSGYWLLTGAIEPTYPRSRVDDLDLDASPLVANGLLATPLVSLYAAFLRATFDSPARPALRWEWEAAGGEAAFAFTHDVDYPEIIRPIEVARVLARRGLKGVPLAARVASGASHFWTFREWVDLAARHGTRPCFYFMARQGSLLQYAMGTPDDFYDVRAPRFQRLFAELRDAGCEIGLHASYNAHRSAAVLRHEVGRIAEAAGVECAGNRHHYWHLDPADPNETLRRHGEAGLRYDSSLGLEYYPGFRRGICHPFRVFHPALRRELPTVQLPPAWMDDHFGGRLTRNRIPDADAAAAAIVDAARATRGIVVVDYHSRGMNADFYPQYGPWLSRFAERRLDDRIRGMTPRELLESYLRREAQLDAASSDETLPPAPAELHVRSARAGGAS